jgi:putative sugar O-methyltransferase
MEADLDGMLEELRAAPAVVRPSRHWDVLAALNLEQLRTDGIAEFKRTLNSNYFQWLPTNVRDPQVHAALRLWRSRPTPLVVTASLGADARVDSRVGNPFVSWRARKVYAVFVAMLWDLAGRRLPESVTSALSEPAFGRPLAVRYRGRSLSQDLCNSALEYAAIVEGMPGRSVRGTVLELGGGYGRLAWVFLSAHRGIRYVMVDIPPALAVAEEYLTTVMPDRRAFRFRRFDSYDAVRDEFEACDVAFITPNQLDLLPPLAAELFINVSSLHEMRHDQIDHYFGQVARHALAGSFYTKQWQRWFNPDDEIDVSHDDYPVPSSWEVVFDRPHPIQTSFFEALYRVR